MAAEKEDVGGWHGGVFFGGAGGRGWELNGEWRRFEGGCTGVLGFKLSS